jgi:hypothetical protein
MKARLVFSSNLERPQLDQNAIELMESNYHYVSERLEESIELRTHPSLIDFLKGEMHGMKLVALALGYKFEEVNVGVKST